MMPPPRMEVRRLRRAPGATSHLVALLSTALLLAGPLGCGPLEDTGGFPSLDERRQVLDTSNGLAMNGLAMNGLAMNGLAMNGLAMNGLSSDAFTSWFQQDPALADTVMHYVVQCAIEEGESRTYTDPSTGASYTWWGRLGLTPDWANGSPANETEQRTVTACMLAHVNEYGLHMTLSVLGRNAWGHLIPFTSSELTTFSETEACFFGNLFTNEGLFFGLDRNSLEGAAMRACKLGDVEDSGVNCPPLVYVGRCKDACVRSGEGPFYESCAYQGVSYRPITTRMTPKDYQRLSCDG